MRVDIYEEALGRLQDSLATLADKPEESAQTTLHALWFTASGSPLSAQGATGKELPCLNPNQELELHRLIGLRLAGTPLAHITGRQQFMGLELLAGPEALIPRKETELLAERAMALLQEEHLGDRRPYIIDLCTGAGNLAIFFALSFKEAKVFASDISPDCIELTQRNIVLHEVSDNVELRMGDLLEPFNSEEFYGNIDLILCNPPYISSGRVGEMAGEISMHEPSQAFDGGPFGISIINRLIQDSLKFLRAGGWLAFEIGLGQGPSVIKRIEKKQSYSRVVPVRDREGNVRTLLAQL